MRCLISNTTDPHFNLATEEYLLKNSNEDIFMLYINEPCIVIGKHQNLLSEINLEYVLENKIHLSRRISGGGTVYQDLNDLNFSFVHNCMNRDQINYTTYITPILEALRVMGLKVELSGRHDILIDKKKISGNAMHIFKNRVLFHGTLLYDTDLEKLSKSLHNNSHKYHDKSIKSIKSKVTNISNYLDHPKSFAQFTQMIFQLISLKSSNHYTKLLDEREEKVITQIFKKKFLSWEWIYGNSPPYVFQNSFNLSNLHVVLELKVERGMIKSINTNLDPTHYQVYNYAFELLVNLKHDFQIIAEQLNNNNIINSTPKFNISEFCYHLF